jgi:YHS domain-containing protein
MIQKIAVSLFVLPLLAGGLPFAAQAAQATSQTATQGDPYPIATCPVSGQELGSMGEPVVREYHGREYRFCCAGCPEKAEADPAKYLGAVDNAIAEQQRASYPLTTCIVSGEPLDSMGAPVEHVYRNRLVRLCCNGCIEKFDSDPAAYLEKLDQAVVEAQQATYPLENCIVSGEALDSMGEPVNFVMHNRLYRLCCNGCIKQLRQSPAEYAEKLDGAASDAANATGAAAHEGHEHQH